ncbi:hypothetical protein [Dyella sp. 20L07]|uniref:hypothetical protein n=1 Tax=Dyella sp. 20L07 TaxID=3384240 RepID=UPI003D2A4B3C
MSKRSAFLLFGLLVSFSGAVPAEDHELHAIIWPNAFISPRGDLRVGDIRIALDCGEFRGLKSIPSDWNADVTGPVSGRSELHLSAGHGASDLASLASLNRVIVVSGVTEKCFSLSITVMTQAAERRLTTTDISLVKMVR